MTQPDESFGLSYRLDDVRESEAAIRSFMRHQYREKLIEARDNHQRELVKAKREAARKAVNARSVRGRVRRLLGRVRAKALRVLGRSPRSASAPAIQSAQADQVRLPRFSVIMPVFNNGPCILEAVESVRQQTLPDVELVIWDDGSSDEETLKILEGISGPGIVKHRAENQGVIGARNSAVAASSGEFLICLDPDDIIEPTYLEKAMITFFRFPRVDLVIPVTRVLGHEDGEKLWVPAPFDERHFSYNNAAPVATAMRRRVWEQVGGLSDHMAGGFEDWAFWRAAAAKGFRGVVLNEPLFRYKFSEATGRDSEARRKKDELERRVKTMFPVLEAGKPPKATQEQSVARLLRQQIFHIPTAEKRGLVIFVPWMLKGGGAENFLLTAIPALAEQYQVAVVATQAPPAGFETCDDAFLDVTPYVYDVPSLVGKKDTAALVHSILMRFDRPIIVNVGSPWAFANMSRIKRWPRGSSRVVDVHFNHIGHISELLEVQGEIDLVLTAHKHLSYLLADYFEIEPPVETLYISPPNLGVIPEPQAVDVVDGPVSIGWLGRNSPEKRIDIVLRLAAIAPEVRFRLAGGGMDGLEDDVSHLSNVEVVGWVKEPAEFIASCDMLINTSDVEGISLSAMEALELGKPVLTRDVGGMSELVSDGKNGLVYDAKDLGTLALRLQDDVLLKEIRNNAASERLPERFSQQQMFETLLAALERDELVLEY